MPDPSLLQNRLPNTQTLLSVEAVVKHYGTHQVNAVQGVSLQIRQEEFVALMGPSGCGKSTLLNLLGTLEQPDSGQIDMEGQALAHADDRTLTRFRQQKLGFIFQFFNLLSTLTVTENVRLPLDLQGKGLEKERQAQVAAMLETVGIAHRAQFYPAQLSGGEMQRVAIARALIHQPALILADEPTGNLDSENGEAILSLLRSITRLNGPAILMATHSVKAARYTDRILHMRDGRLVEPDPESGNPTP